MKYAQNKKEMMVDFREAGFKIIVAEGYDALTIRRLISVSGKSNGSFYTCYSDKEDLARDIVDNYISKIVKEVVDEYDDNFNVYINLKIAYRYMLDSYISNGKEFVSLLSKVRISMLNLDSCEVDYINKMYVKGIGQNEFDKFDTKQMAFSMCILFYGTLINSYANDENDFKVLNKMLNNQLKKFIDGVKVNSTEKDIWERLNEVGVDTTGGIKRFSNNKETYLKFLKEFFDDEDFTNCRNAIENKEIEDAFEYAHGLKGLAGTLSINTVYSELVELVEILRNNSLEGAMEAYHRVVDECLKITKVF